MKLTYGGGTVNVVEAQKDIAARKGRVLLKVIETDDGKYKYGFFLQNTDGTVVDICARGRQIRTLTSAGPTYEYLKMLDPDLKDIEWPLLRKENAIRYGHNFEPYEEPRRISSE